MSPLYSNFCCFVICFVAVPFALLLCHLLYSFAISLWYSLCFYHAGDNGAEKVVYRVKRAPASVAPKRVHWIQIEFPVLNTTVITVL